MVKDKQKVTDELIHDVARAASVAPESVMRAMLGLPVRGLAGERVREELTKRGLR